FQGRHFLFGLLPRFSLQQGTGPCNPVFCFGPVVHGFGPDRLRGHLLFGGAHFQIPAEESQSGPIPEVGTDNCFCGHCGPSVVIAQIVLILQDFMSGIKLIECPRDAMQGIRDFIPTERKIAYIQSLLGCGFDTLDFGSFVSPRAIPQMRDTAEVLAGLDLSRTKTGLLAIVANIRGAEDACGHGAIEYLGYPFSISENFQMRNTHKTIAQSVETLKGILELAHEHGKQVVTYISIGFGNPYGDPWNVEIVGEWT